MKQNVFSGFLKITVLTILGLVIGFFIGMNIGGNYDTSFEFLGGVGYEATGYLGGIVGASIGLLISILWVYKYSSKIG